MRIGLIIPIFNRLPYLQQTIDSLKKSQLPENLTLFLVNDGSTQKELNDYFQELTLDNVELIKFPSPVNQGVWAALYRGFTYFCDNVYDIIINLDSDAIVKSEWMTRILDLHNRFPDTIVSGFNTTSNHPIESAHEDYYVKQTLGGMNMVFNRYLYMAVIKPALSEGVRWDWGVVKRMMEMKKKFIVSRPSVIQHIGFESNYKHQHVDTSPDF